MHVKYSSNPYDFFSNKTFSRLVLCQLGILRFQTSFVFKDKEVLTFALKLIQKLLQKLSRAQCLGFHAVIRIFRGKNWDKNSAMRYSYEPYVHRVNALNAWSICKFVSIIYVNSMDKRNQTSSTPSSMHFWFWPKSFFPSCRLQLTFHISATQIYGRRKDERIVYLLCYNGLMLQ